MVQLLVASTYVCPDNVAPLHTIAVLSYSTSSVFRIEHACTGSGMNL